MWPDLDRIHIYLRPGRTDMRKQIYGLVSLITEQGTADLFDGSLYLFCGRDNTMIKALYWDSNGFCLWTKRMEQGRFPWPGTGQGDQKPFSLSRQELEMMLAGIDFRKRFRPLKYSHIA